MFLVVSNAGWSDSVAYQTAEVLPGDGEVFTDEEGLLDLSQYVTFDLDDEMIFLGAKV